MKNILTFLTFVILMNTSLNADSSTKNIKSFLEIDECASFATSLCLQYASPDFGYMIIQHSG